MTLRNVSLAVVSLALFASAPHLCKTISDIMAAPASLASAYEVLVVSSLEKVLPDATDLWHGTLPPAAMTMARNEQEAVQVVIRSPKQELRQVAVSISGLDHADGAGRIPAHAVRWNRVGFVKTRKPDYDVIHAGRWPDPLLAAEPFDVPKGDLVPLWITVTTDAETPPGEYRGTITLQPENAQAQEIGLRVRVWNFTLPTTPGLTTSFDVYPNRIKSGYEKFFPEWWTRWEQHPHGVAALQQDVFDDLMAHRIAAMRHVEPDSEAALNPLRELVGRGLSAFAVGGSYGGSFDNNWPEDPQALAALQPTYARYARHLREAGLLPQHYLYFFDEPEPGLPRVAEVGRMLKAADPELRTLVTLGAPFDPAQLRDWLAPIDILCLRNVSFDPAAAEALKAQGKEVWLYVSGPKPPFPTLVIDERAIEHRLIPWMCWRYGLSGLLYWTVNFWTTNPYEQPMNTPWQQYGNGSLYYPGPEGPVHSVRLEVLRDGLEDYDYLQLLAQVIDKTAQAVPADRAGGEGVPTRDGATADEAASTERERLLAEARSLIAIPPKLVTSMAEYATDPQILLERRDRIAAVIEQLQQWLGGV